MPGIYQNGGESRRVGELSSAVIFELEAYPEPKALLKKDLLVLMKQFSSTIKVARYIGASQAFVWGKLTNKKKWDSKKKKFVPI